MSADLTAVPGARTIASSALEHRGGTCTFGTPGDVTHGVRTAMRRLNATSSASLELLLLRPSAAWSNCTSSASHRLGSAYTRRTIAWYELEALRASGVARKIGVSDVDDDALCDLLLRTHVMPDAVLLTPEMRRRAPEAAARTAALLTRLNITRVVLAHHRASGEVADGVMQVLQQPEHHQHHQQEHHQPEHQQPEHQQPTHPHLSPTHIHTTSQTVALGGIVLSRSRPLDTDPNDHQTPAAASTDLHLLQRPPPPPPSFPPWPALESFDGLGADLAHRTPMHAVVRGEASCVIVRNVLTPTQATAALHRLYERELISPVDGRAGHAALAYPFRRHAGAVETGVTLQVPCAASTPLPALIEPLQALDDPNPNPHPHPHPPAAGIRRPERMAQSSRPGECTTRHTL